MIMEKSLIDKCVDDHISNVKSLSVKSSDKEVNNTKALFPGRE